MPLLSLSHVKYVVGSGSVCVRYIFLHTHTHKQNIHSYCIQTKKHSAIHLQFVIEIAWEHTLSCIPNHMRITSWDLCWSLTMTTKHVCTSHQNESTLLVSFIKGLIVTGNITLPGYRYVNLQRPAWQEHWSLSCLKSTWLIYVVKNQMLLIAFVCHYIPHLFINWINYINYIARKIQIQLVGETCQEHMPGLCFNPKLYVTCTYHCKNSKWCMNTCN